MMERLKTCRGAVDDVASELLFKPLGITDYAWTKNLKSGILEVGGLRMPGTGKCRVGSNAVQISCKNQRALMRPALPRGFERCEPHCLWFFITIIYRLCGGIAQQRAIQ